MTDSCMVVHGMAWDLRAPYHGPHAPSKWMPLWINSVLVGYFNIYKPGDVNLSHSSGASASKSVAVCSQFSGLNLD